MTVFLEATSDSLKVMSSSDLLAVHGPEAASSAAGRVRMPFLNNCIPILRAVLSIRVIVSFSDFRMDSDEPMIISHSFSVSTQRLESLVIEENCAFRTYFVSPVAGTLFLKIALKIKTISSQSLS